MLWSAPHVPSRQTARQLQRVYASQQTESKAADSGSDSDSSVRQMLGMKGAAEETDKFKIRVQLTKPVTWVPLIWGTLSIIPHIIVYKFG